jgi:acetamidase/formamidase/AraC-like DNA-binding protein
MSICEFTSESYGETDRDAAWQEILGEVGLRSACLVAMQSLHATAYRRASSDGVVVARLTAGAQKVWASPRGADLPLALIVLKGAAALNSDGARHPFPAGCLALLPRRGAWQINFEREMQAVALSVRSTAFHGRKTGPHLSDHPRVLPAGGVAGILASSLNAAAQALETLSTAEWAAVSQTLAELLLTLVCEPAATGHAAGVTSARAALLHRIYRTIERRLEDPALSPAQVAEAEGISERYLQKLFEGINDNFTRYVRGRRLHRASADLANPANACRSVSEIAYRYGFNDAARFSHAFRERFGVSPRAFRRQGIEQLAAVGDAPGQRGWPQEALVHARARRVEAEALAIPPAGGSSAAARCAPRHHHLPVGAKHIHWGFFSRALKPIIEIASGDTITVETLTQHASDDPERMIAGDQGAESVFHWTSETKTVDRRGAGPMDASVFGRGAGEGFGVHICTGPIAVKDAQPGDVLEVRILDIAPRPSHNPRFEGRMFGSNAATWWGYHYSEQLSRPKPREVVTIYEIFPSDATPYARALYSYRWAPQTDPSGVVHKIYDYPGVLVAPGSVERRHSVMDGIRIPLRLHFGVIGVAPREADLVDSIPPSHFGGNIDNWRLGKGAAVYLPVSVPGALLSIGDPHAAQGDGELSGTAIECSMTGTFKMVLHRKADLAGQPFADLTYPLIETETEWVLSGFSHPNYLAEFGVTGQSQVYAKSSLDLAMKDAFRKVRRFLMNTCGLDEDEAVTLMSAAVDFGVTQVVDGNWGVHAILNKSMFPRQTGS